MERRIDDNKIDELIEEVITLNRVIFGDEATGDKGMKEKVDDIHSLLVQAKNIGGFFGGIKSLIGWMLVVGAFILALKGWLSALIAYFINK
jgi:hypothetical protein